MKITVTAGFGAALLLAGFADSLCLGQVNQGITTPAAQYFGSRSANAVLQNQYPTAGRQYAPTHHAAPVTGGKPFNHIQRQSTLSPYLALDAVPESNTSMPNWHLFVQPQLQQNRSAEARTRELIRTRQQMRVATARHIVPENPPIGAPITGSSTQFMNMGSYFPGMR